VYDELVYQRLAQGFQLVIEPPEPLITSSAPGFMSPSTSIHVDTALNQLSLRDTELPTTIKKTTVDLPKTDSSETSGVYRPGKTNLAAKRHSRTLGKTPLIMNVDQGNILSPIGGKPASFVNSRKFTPFGPVKDLEPPEEVNSLLFQYSDGELIAWQ